VAQLLRTDTRPTPLCDPRSMPIKTGMSHQYSTTVMLI